MIGIGSGTRLLLLGTALCLILLAGLPLGAEPRRNDWYWDTVVNLHIDNHSLLAGKGYTVDELADMVEGIDVSMIQVSAMGSRGTTTYQTRIRRHPEIEDWDTLAAWRQVADRLDKRFGIYINTRGLFLHHSHPEWVQLNAMGKGKGKGEGLDICMRASKDQSGALERVFLPMVKEFGLRDKPDALWVDGDHARTCTCYCRNCKAAWKERTGKEGPPVAPEDPDWPHWLAFQMERLDGYRMEMARSIHEVCPSCLYTSNHSWRFSGRDPRSPPPFVDTLSGDLSHGLALRSTRVSAMALSPEDDVPHDIMHNIMSVKLRKSERASFRRIVQMGGLTLASGSVWFLWAPGDSILKEEVQGRARRCAAFAREREGALGRTTSLKQVAVVLSETCWERERLEGMDGYYDRAAAERAALGIEDAHYCVDMPNEVLLEKRIDQYSTVVVSNQRVLAEQTMDALRGFARRGGLLLVTGRGLEDVPDLAGFLGAHGGVKSQGDDAVPGLTTCRVGKGTLALWERIDIPYPDEDSLWSRVMDRLGMKPAIRVQDASREAQMVFSIRGKGEARVLHVTDLTSSVNGKPIVPSMKNNIDDPGPLRKVVIRMDLPWKPSRVTTFPLLTQATHEWSKGTLKLSLTNLDVHTAVVFHRKR